MNDEQIDIAIAEVCGTMKWSYALPAKTKGCDVQQYTEDLNAMYGAFEWLRERDETAFARLDDELFRGTPFQCPSWHATARQRAEAFLRATGKWVDA